ncbi:hypothetical protein ACVME8_005342 [Bradyrhizobium diazoefficiens]
MTPPRSLEDARGAFVDEVLRRELVSRTSTAQTGKPADIPPVSHAAAATYWRLWQALQEMRAAFELELCRIDFDEMKTEETAQSLPMSPRLP